MSVILGAGDSSYFTIDGLPHQRGDFVPVYDGDYISLRRKEAIRNEVDGLGRLHYTEYIDQSTGEAMATKSQLATWFAGNLFSGVIGTSTTTSIQFIHLFKIKENPVLADEKPEGATLTDDFLTTINALFIKIGTDDYELDTDFTQALNVVTFTEYLLQDGDYVVVCGSAK